MSENTPSPSSLVANQAPNCRIILVGASGVIGGQLLATAQTQERPAVGTYFQNARPGMVAFDMTQQPLTAVVPDLGPGDTVVLLSARADPNWVFENPWDSREINVVGNIRAADDARNAGARVVFVSSEYVFDGVSGGYGEDARPAPTTLYGQQKVEVEEHLQATGNRWAIVRLGWTVGWERDTRCPVFNTFKTLMTKGARMAEDNTFTLSDVRDTAKGILEVADRDENTIWHLASAPPVTRSDLADWVMETSKFSDLMAFERVRFAEIPYPEQRPERSWIVNHRAVQNLQVQFAEPWRTVEEKVKLVDQWFEERQK